MPHIRVRGMQPQQVQEFSENLSDQLATIMGTSPDNFTIEHIPSEYFFQGKRNLGYPFVEILWFERPPEVKQMAALHITNRIKRIVGDMDVAVLFCPLNKSDYFENGNHF